MLRPQCKSKFIVIVFERCPHLVPLRLHFSLHLSSELWRTTTTFGGTPLLWKFSRFNIIYHSSSPWRHGAMLAREAK